MPGVIPTSNLIPSEFLKKKPREPLGAKGPSPSTWNATPRMRNGFDRTDGDCCADCCCGMAWLPRPAHWLISPEERARVRGRRDRVGLP